MFLRKMEGMRFTADPSTNPYVEVFRDASFGDHSHASWSSNVNGAAAMRRAG